MIHPGNLVKIIVNKIARAVHPNQIILFGSRALGTTRKDSNVDLLTREFNQLTSERHVYADKDIPYEYSKPGLSDDKRYLSCPLCENIMLRKNFKTISGVLIDQWRDHGIWLDAGELE